MSNLSNFLKSLVGEVNKSVKTRKQSFTDAEKIIARDNIGAYGFDWYNPNGSTMTVSNVIGGNIDWRAAEVIDGSPLQNILLNLELLMFTHIEYGLISSNISRLESIKTNLNLLVDNGIISKPIITFAYRLAMVSNDGRAVNQATPFDYEIVTVSDTGIDLLYSTCRSIAEGSFNSVYLFNGTEWILYKPSDFYGNYGENLSNLTVKVNSISPFYVTLNTVYNDDGTETYSADKTLAEIFEARNKGAVIYCVDGNRLYPLTYANESKAQVRFEHMNGQLQGSITCINDEWEVNYYTTFLTDSLLPDTATIGHFLQVSELDPTNGGIGKIKLVDNPICNIGICRCTQSYGGFESNMSYEDIINACGSRLITVTLDEYSTERYVTSTYTRGNDGEYDYIMFTFLCGTKVINAKIVEGSSLVNIEESDIIETCKQQLQSYIDEQISGGEW